MAEERYVGFFEGGKRRSPEMERRYRYFNETLFGNKLPNIPIFSVPTLKSVMGRARVRVIPPEGLTVAQRNMNARMGDRYAGYTIQPGSLSIDMSSLLKRNEQQMDATLIHEMIHIEMYVLGHFHLNHEGLFLQRLREIEKQVGYSIPISESTGGYEVNKVRNLLVVIATQRDGSVVYAIINPKFLEVYSPDMLLSSGSSYGKDVKIYSIFSPLWTREATYVPIQTGKGRRLRLKMYIMGKDVTKVLLHDLETNGKLIARSDDRSSAINQKIAY